MSFIVQKTGGGKSVSCTGIGVSSLQAGGAVGASVLRQESVWGTQFSRYLATPVILSYLMSMYALRPTTTCQESSGNLTRLTLLESQYYETFCKC
jgi:hypothetical protein